MRRQATAGDILAGPGRALRLDPFALPVRYSATLAGSASEAAILLEPDRAVVRRTVAGIPSAVTVKVSSYRGVAVRFEESIETGEVRVIVELMHRDPALSLPLAVAEDPADIAADWQAFGRIFGLPLLLIETDGSIREPVARMGAITVSETRPRRRHSFFADRRPRFLVRRKPGARRPEPELILGREIIARD